MSEMVERVAKAHVAFLQVKDPETTPWDNADEDMRDAMRELARVVIVAMREPTDEMVEAAFGKHGNPNPFRTAWINMIDEALKP